MAEEKKYEITEMELKMYIGLAMADTIPEGAARDEALRSCFGICL